MRVTKLSVAIVLAPMLLFSLLSNAQVGMGSGPVQGQTPAKVAGITPPTPRRSNAAPDKSVSENTQGGQAQVPDSVIYQFFFLHIANLEKVAQDEQRKGNAKSASLWRTHDQRAAGLNGTEGRLIRQIALDCNQELKVKNKEIQTLVNNLHTQRLIGDPAGEPVPQELVQMRDERVRALDSYIGRLRVELGEGSFNKLDTYIRTTFQFSSVRVATQSVTSTTVSSGENHQ